MSSHKSFFNRVVEICGEELPTLTTCQDVACGHKLAVSADRRLYLVGTECRKEDDNSETFKRFALVVMDESQVGPVGDALYNAWKAALPPVIGWLRCHHYTDGAVSILPRSPYPGEVSAHPTRVVERPHHGVICTWDWNSREARIYVDPLRADPGILPTLRREREALDKAAAAEAARAAEVEAKAALAAREAEHDRYRSYRDLDRSRPGYEW